MAVSRRLRFEILRRDNFTCRYCGSAAPDVVLHVDHVIPVTLGGGDTANNLVTACEDCNQGKGSTTVDMPEVEEVDATAALVERAQRVASERRRMELAKIEGFFDDFEAYYREKVYEAPGGTSSYGPAWTTSVERFMSEGLEPEDLYYYVRVVADACPRKPWPYFCGCCWKEITRRQEDARRLIEDGEV